MIQRTNMRKRKLCVSVMLVLLTMTLALARAEVCVCVFVFCLCAFCVCVRVCVWRLRAMHVLFAFSLLTLATPLSYHILSEVIPLGNLHACQFLILLYTQNSYLFCSLAPILAGSPFLTLSVVHVKRTLEGLNVGGSRKHS
jgi:hypothetical protein